MITYIATNIKTGKFYIGSTKNFDKRKSQHLKRKINRPFQSSLRKNPENFIWHFVEDNLEEPKFEQILLDMYFGTELCYNLNPKADRPPSFKGGKHTEAQKQAHSKRMFGENHPNYGKTGVLSPISKAIIAIKPDGTEFHFESITEAARELGINPGHLCSRYLKTVKSPRWGKFKEWRFVYGDTKRFRGKNTQGEKVK